MPTHTVDHLDVHLHGSGLSRTDLIAAERFTRAALDLAFSLVEQRLQGRLLVVRSLQFISKAGLRSTDPAIAGVAGEISSALIKVIDRSPVPPHHSDDVALFESPAQRAALAAEELSSGARPWFASMWTDLDECLTWAAQEPDRARHVRNLLAQRGTLHSVLSQAKPALRLAITDAPTTAANATLAPSQKSESTNANTPRHQPTPSVQHASHKLPPAPQHDHAPPHAARQETSQASGTGQPLNAATAPRPHPPGAPSTPALAPQPGTHPTHRTHATSVAGLFYLLNPALELELGKALWRAGVDQAMIFTDAARLLARHAPPDDPAPIAFGGPGLSPVDWDQCTHVTRTVLTELGSTINRRRLREFPLHATDAVLDGQRVTILGLPPHAPLLGLLSGHRHALDQWPFDLTSASDVAGPVGDELEFMEHYLGSGVPEDTARRALAATVAGSLRALACLRLERYSEGSPTEHLAAALDTPGRLESTDDDLLVRMDAAQVLLPIRRAGLDRNPGWIPWQGRTIRFEFVEGASPNLNRPGGNAQ